MKKSLVSFATAATVVALNAMLIAPVVEAKAAIKPVYRLSVSAIKGKDEKNFDNPASRCLTKEMKALQAKTVKQMDADIAKKGKGFPQAVETYIEKIETIWSAMEQPYCGYGSQGMTAVKKSYLKSVERARSEFLEEVK